MKKIKLVPKKMIWKIRCPGLYGGYVDNVQIMQIKKTDTSGKWFFYFTGDTFLKNVTLKNMSYTMFEKYSSVKKEAEKEYLKSFKSMIEHLELLIEK